MSSAFTIRVPATLANLGPGFDSFGMAVDQYNLFHINPNASVDKICFAQPGLELSDNPADNLVFRAANYLAKALGQSCPPFELTIDARLPLARGLGSSSTAIVAGLLAANRLFSDPCDLPKLCQLATALEGHPDNVVPALLGGVRLCDGPQSYHLPWSPDWAIILVIPAYPILTEEARRVLPAQPSRADAVFNLRKASLLTYALLKEDSNVFASSLSDALHQPYRAQLIPEFQSVSQLASHHGAMGTIISGSGSTLAVFSQRAQHEQLLSILKKEAGKRPGTIVIAVNVDLQGATIQ